MLRDLRAPKSLLREHRGLSCSHEAKMSSPSDFVQRRSTISTTPTDLVFGILLAVFVLSLSLLLPHSLLSPRYGRMIWRSAKARERFFCLAKSPRCLCVFFLVTEHGSETLKICHLKAGPTSHVLEGAAHLDSGYSQERGRWA